MIASKEESKNHWQQKDYKGFNSSTDWDTADFSKVGLCVAGGVVCCTASLRRSQYAAHPSVLGVTDAAMPIERLLP